MENLEGHLKWIQELALYIQKLAKAKNESLDSYCWKLLKGNKSKDAFDRGWNEWSTILAKRMNKAALAIRTGNTEKASLLLNELESLVENLTDVTDKKLRVILYFKNVLQWQNGGGVDSEEEKRLNREWADLVDLGANEVEATICYFKGRLGHKMKIEEEKVKELHLEAHRLDPSCLAWCHHAYHGVRRSRRNGNYGNVMGPSELEKDLAEKAYRLGDNGRNMIAAADYGLMLKECLKTKDQRFQEDNPEQYWECVRVFEEGLKNAEGFALMKIQVYLAEFLYFGSGPQNDKKVGGDMFLDLEREYPNSISVLHKVGKVYFVEDELEKARECYKRAIELDPTAMPCVMDYLKLLKRDMRRSYLKNQAKSEIIRILKKALSPEYVTFDKSTTTLQNELDLVMKEKETFQTAADLDDNWRRK